MYRAKTKDGQEVKGWLTQNKKYDNLKKCFRMFWFINIYEEDKFGVPTIDDKFEVIPSTIAQQTGQTDSTKWEELTLEEQKSYVAHAETMERLEHPDKTWNGKDIYGSIEIDGVMTKGGDVVQVKMNGLYHGKSGVEIHGGVKLNECGFFVDVSYKPLVSRFTNDDGEICKIIGKQYDKEEE